MRAYFKPVLLISIVAIIFGFCPPVSATTYDLKTDWNTVNAPGSPWEVLEGATLFTKTTGRSPVDPLPPGTYFSTGYVPLWSNADLSGFDDSSEYQAGDIWTHSANPGSAVDTLRWIAPAAGTISISGDIWFLQWNLDRSNDWSLYLDGTLLDSGTVAYSGPDSHLRANPDTFDISGLSVAAGDTISLYIEPSASQPWGTMSGVNLAIVDSSGAPVPEGGAPMGYALLGFAAIVGALVLRARGASFGTRAA